MDRRLMEVLRACNTVRLIALINENPSCLTGVTSKGNNALHIAAGLGYGCPELTQICIRHPAFLTAVNAKGDTPLHRAARAGHASAVELFICLAKACGEDTKRALLETRNGCGNTPLHEALQGRHVDAASGILSEHPQLAALVNNSGESPLYLAAERGALEIVQTLLDYDPICDTRGPGGQTALHAAVCRSYDITKLLLKKRPGLNRQVDASQSTPLHYAVSIGDRRMVQLLLEDDASTTHLLDKDGLSPIHIAASMGDTDIIEKIISHCPDASELTDKKGKNFLHIAVEKKRSKVVKYVLKNYALKDLLNEADHEGNTPLHLATISHNREIVHLFLADNRVDTTPRNQKGLTPLDLASSCVNSSIRLRTHKIMTELLSAGSQFSPQRMDLMTNELHQKREEEINRCRALANNLAIVAVLIATVTFAAAFTLPGGYNDDGMAVLTKSAAFKAFLISDTVAMVSSLIVTCLLIYTGSLDHDIRLHSISTAMNFMWVALGGMVVAFATGTYVVIASDCKWLAILVSIVACCVPFGAWMVSCWPALDTLKLVRVGRNQGRRVGGHASFKGMDFRMPHYTFVDFRTPSISKCDQESVLEINLVTP